MNNPEYVDAKTFAWIARNPVTKWYTVVFHSDKAKAELLGAIKLGEGSNTENVRVSRAKQFDQYAEQGYVPTQQILKFEESTR